MQTEDEAIEEYWCWFEDHRTEFDLLDDPDETFWDLALGALKRVDPALWFELSALDQKGREMIITAEGDAAAFPLVDRMIAMAPALDGWEFFALKPRMGFDFQTDYEGIRFDPRTMWFLPLENGADPRSLGLRVAMPDFTQDISRQALNAVAIILDTGLGERTAALDIQHLEVAPIPDDPEGGGYIELVDLLDYIEWRKRKLVVP